MQKLRLSALFLLLMAFNFSNANAQVEPDSLLKDAPNVFLDCPFCSENFIRQNINWLNYVRDRKVADVHILVTRQETGSGGQEYSFQFLGQGKYEGMDDTIVVSTPPNSTNDFIQNARTRTIKLGMIRFIAQTPMAENLMIDYNVPIEPTNVEDRWNNWVYEIGSGAWFNKEESYQSLNSWADISATRITPEIKIELSAGGSYNESKYDLGDEILTNIQRSQYFNSRVVKSINDHWSYGTSLNARASIYNNFKVQITSYPGIEYNLFPYEESTRRQLRIRGSLGFQYRHYNDTTIYDKIEENFFESSLDIAYRVQEKWGSIEVSLNGSALVNDFAKNEVRLWSNLNLRLFKGFSLRLSGNAALIRNQLNLVKGEVSEEDILLRQRQIASNYSFWGNVGISYTFGSIYNTVVNPRFGG